MSAWFWQLYARVTAFLRVRNLDRDFDQELESHLEMLAADHRRRGMPPEQALRAARLELGRATQLREAHRDVRGMPVLSAFFQDLQYALRTLRKSPSFTITALAALAVGIGATTAIFSIVNNVLLKPIPIANADRVVILATLLRDESGAGSLHGGTSPAKFRHWRDQSAYLEDISVFSASSEPINYTAGAIAEQWNASMLSRDAYRCLGIRIVLGRTFTPEEDLPDGQPVAVISEALWSRRFAKDPAILGRTVALNGAPRTVVGIAADGPVMQELGNNPQVYLPAQFDPNSRDFGSAGGVFSVARIKSGITLEQAKARLRASASEYREKFPGNIDSDDTFVAVPIREFLVGDVRRFLLILLGAVSLVLLIACANVASLSLARARSRSREIAVRTALGAGQSRIVRQLMTESLLLSLAGGAIGLALGFGGIRSLLALNTAHLPRLGGNGVGISIDWRVAAFTLTVSIVTGIIFGLSPALQAARADLNAILKYGSGRTDTGFRQNRSRAILVVSEVTLAVVLMVGSALLIRSFVALYKVDRGFDTSNVLTMRSLMAGPQYSKPATVIRATNDGLERVRALPGVVAVSATCCVPLEERITLPFEVIGRPSADPGHVGWRTISPGYFDVLKIPLKQGRPFTLRDDAKSPLVAVINERMAREFWKDGDPLKDRIVLTKGVLKGFDDEPARQIVGIVGDTRQQLNADPVPTMYVPQAQINDTLIPMIAHATVWLVRTQPGTHALLPIQEQLRQATGVPAADVRSMDEVVKLSTGRERFSMLVMTIFGGVALLLAAIGIYGLMAYIVGQRMHEIGIRVALGAQASKVRRMVVRQGMRLALAGVGFGLAAAWALARTLESLLFEVKSRDPLVFAVVPILLTAVALIAVWMPALRASNVDPADALRHE
ncbi:MAG TPA: ABC transporter permease [Bryobacteraceae bacterium]